MVPQLGEVETDRRAIPVGAALDRPHQPGHAPAERGPVCGVDIGTLRLTGALLAGYGANVLVPLGIGQAFHHQHADAFAKNGAVGIF